MSTSPFHLESLLAPLSLDEFFTRYWEKGPFTWARHQPFHYQTLLNPSAIDFIISSAFATDKAGVEALGTTEIKKFLKGETATVVSELYDAHRRGSTIRVNRVHR